MKPPIVVVVACRRSRYYLSIFNYLNLSTDTLTHGSTMCVFIFHIHADGILDRVHLLHMLSVRCAIVDDIFDAYKLLFECLPDTAMCVRILKYVYLFN